MNKETVMSKESLTKLCDITPISCHECFSLAPSKDNIFKFILPDLESMYKKRLLDFTLRNRELKTFFGISSH